MTKSLNGWLSNRPWTDADPPGLKEGGKPGKGKRAILDDFNLLVVNKDHLKIMLTLRVDRWRHHRAVEGACSGDLRGMARTGGGGDCASRRRRCSGPRARLSAWRWAMSRGATIELRASLGRTEMADEEGAGRSYSKAAIRDRLLTGPLGSRSVGIL